MNYLASKPNITVLFILLIYNILGLTILGFNRTPLQVALTVGACGLFQVLLDYIFKKEPKFPTSAIVTGLGLSILLNYGHNYWLTLIPVFFAIMTKYIFTFKGKHIFNPGLMGVTLSFLLTNELISPAPAYQWNGIGMMSLFIAAPAIFLFMPKINRHWLVGSFLLTFTAQLILRSLIMKHYLPFNTLFFGTITSPAFFLFTFFMITDPATTPSPKAEQIKTGIIIGILDLLFHLVSSYHTFFYAALTLGTYKLFKNHIREMLNSGSIYQYLKDRFFLSRYYLRPVLALSIIFISVGFYQNIILDNVKSTDYGFAFERIEPGHSGIKFNLTNEVLNRTDSRVHNVAKWILSISDGVAIGDYDNDGLQDILFANGLKADGQRNALYRNLGDFKFTRVKFDEIEKVSYEVEKYGVPSNATFVDYDNDNDLDLFILYAFGKLGTSRLFKNQLSETGKVEFIDITKNVGIMEFTNAAALNFSDLNNDGKLDLIIGNTTDTHLRDYDKPVKFDLFNLPKEEFEGDRRMFHFMHESWHMANNGGMNNFYYQNDNGKFIRLDNVELGAPETRWTMAIATADFNHDGLIDLYMANDFGPDDLYFNTGNFKFINHKEAIFGSIGNDTYKGMNATIADFDRNGYQDVYISNVHHALQAEGSQLWSFGKNEDSFIPLIKERATYWGALNENRFGWGAGAADFNNDGWVDLIQANGMVDDKVDKEHEDCPDYWYYNEKIARSPPIIHTYSDNWADIRGRCIYGNERNRVYVNRGNDLRPKFIDIAKEVGLTDLGNYRGIAPVDFNNDGRVDLLVTSHYRQPILMANKATGKKNNWIGIDLLNDGLNSCNKKAIGSRIKLTYKEKVNGSSQKEIHQYHELTVANGFSAQADRRALFGISKSQHIESVEVDWCLQEKRVYKNLGINQYHQIKYSDPLNVKRLGLSH